MAHLVEKADAKVHQIAHKVEDTIGTGRHLDRGYHHVGGRAPYVASGVGGYHHVGGAGAGPNVAGGAGGYHHVGGAAGAYQHIGGRAPYTDGSGSYVGGPSGTAGPHVGGAHFPAVGGHHQRRHHHQHGRRRPVGAEAHVAGGHHQVGGPVAFGGGAGPHFGGRPTGFYVGGVHALVPGRHRHQHHHVGGHHHFGGRPVNRVLHPVKGGGMHHLNGSY